MNVIVIKKLVLTNNIQYKVPLTMLLGSRWPDRGASCSKSINLHKKKDYTYRRNSMIAKN